MLAEARDISSPTRSHAFSTPCPAPFPLPLRPRQKRSSRVARPRLPLRNSFSSSSRGIPGANGRPRGPLPGPLPAAVQLFRPFPACPRKEPVPAAAPPAGGNGIVDRAPRTVAFSRSSWFRRSRASPARPGAGLRFVYPLGSPGMAASTCPKGGPPRWCGVHSGDVFAFPFRGFWQDLPVYGLFVLRPRRLKLSRLKLPRLARGPSRKRPPRPRRPFPQTASALRPGPRPMSASRRSPSAMTSRHARSLNREIVGHVHEQRFVGRLQPSGVDREGGNSPLRSAERFIPARAASRFAPPRLCAPDGGCRARFRCRLRFVASESTAGSPR